MSDGHETPVFPIKFAGFMPCAVDEEMRLLSEPNEVTRLSQVIGHGKTTMLHFWSSWCLPCVDELPEIVAFANRSRDAVDFVAVNHDKTEEAALAFLADKPWMKDICCYFDPAWKLEHQFFGLQIPATVFFGPGGHAVGIWENGLYAPPLIVGPRRWQDECYSELVKDIASGNQRYQELGSASAAMPTRYITSRLPIPDVELVGTYPAMVRSTDFRDKVTIFHFWNINCNSSLHTLPELISFVRNHSDAVQLVPILIGASHGVEKAYEVVQRFCRQNPWTDDAVWYLDPKDELWKRVWGSLHPGTIFVDPKGSVVTFEENDVISHIMSGERPWTQPVYAEFIRDIFEGNDAFKKHAAAQKSQ